MRAQWVYAIAAAIALLLVGALTTTQVRRLLASLGGEPEMVAAAVHEVASGKLATIAAELEDNIGDFKI
ncbi:hypothetical protein [Rhabdochromatium marinum]|uniref:hypothetical protein n=1 Tax=Rhabdochromatium marinum TaxID=48729 RepID=UPI0019079B01|nr:hypothetical protein [Rhabdochromatium marinum]MBK1647399.1 hypothetical protein [Rhabdochromatium marinum]